jgi:hypothetical protein
MYQHLFVYQHTVASHHRFFEIGLSELISALDEPANASDTNAGHTPIMEKASEMCWLLGAVRGCAVNRRPRLGISPTNSLPSVLQARVMCCSNGHDVAPAECIGDLVSSKLPTSGLPTGAGDVLCKPKTTPPCPDRELYRSGTNWNAAS